MAQEATPSFSSSPATTPSTDTDVLSGLEVPASLSSSSGGGRGGEEGGEGNPTHQSPWLPRFFHFVTRRFYLSCLEGYLNNSPSGLKETEADNKHAPLLSPEHHPLIKTSSRDVREKGRGRHAQCLSSHLPPLAVPPQSVMETELFVNHRCYPANQFRQFSSYGAKPRSTKSERMVYCPCMV